MVKRCEKIGRTENHNMVENISRELHSINGFFCAPEAETRRRRNKEERKKRRERKCILIKIPYDKT